MMVRRRFLRCSALAACSFAWPRASFAQSFPARPITMVVPFPAGGPGDTVGRILVDHMSASLGQPIVIENVSGAAGSIGTGRVARAAPDGHMVVLGYWGTHVVNGAIYSLQYDVVKDFEPIALLPGQPMMIVAKKGMPANDLMELVAWLKANPEKASQGTAGTGSIGHVAGLMFQKQTGTRYQFIPYRGTAPVMQDLVGGQIDLNITVPVAALPQTRAGLIKAFAVMAPSRLPIAPEIPTADEAGVAGLHLSLWQGLWAPKATPKAVIARLNAAVMRALADSTVRQKLADQGFDIPTLNQQTPDALGAHQRAEIDRWWPIIKAASIKAE